MATDTFALSANDQDSCGYKRGSTFATLSAETFDENPFGATLISLSCTSSGEFWILNGFMRFDTSTLPDGATITGANLKVYVDTGAEPDGIQFAADFYDFGGTPAVDADWEATSSGDAIATIDVGSLTQGAVNTIALTGLTGISKTGITGLRFAPKTGATPTGDNYVDFAAFDHGSFQEPRLEVTYSSGTSATVDLDTDNAVATATASVVAPPKPRPTPPFSEVNLRM